MQQVISKKRENKSSSRWYRLATRGFTLVELLVVIAILGILAGIAIGAIKGAQASARDAQRKSDLADIRSALEIYRADCGNYPSTLTFGGTLVGSGSGNCLSTNTYMSTVPKDPQFDRSGVTYAYAYDSTNKKYAICSYLEHPGSATGTQCVTSGSTATATGCGNGRSCYYTLISP
jgi:type II secretion system protein G